MHDTASRVLCNWFWPICFLKFYARYIGVDGGEQPDFNSEFIGPPGTATLARRMIPVLLGRKLDAGKAVTNANVFVALNVKIRHVDVSRTMFFMWEKKKKKKQVAKWRFGMEELLLVTFHDTVSSSDIARRLSWVPRTCLAEERESTSPPCSIYILLRSLSFQPLAGDA